jgi:hypothetical protein
LSTQIKIPENQIDLVNILFTQLEITYHNQFHKAFPDPDSLKLAKQLWLQKISAYKNEIIFKSVDHIMSTSEYLPSLSSVLKKCKEFTLDSNGIPSLERSYQEAPLYCDDPNDHQWSHPLVYHAGKETGWYFLKNESEQNAFKEFSKSFDLVIHNWLEGKKYNSPEITKIEEAKPNLDKSSQLNLIKRLKDKF